MNKPMLMDRLVVTNLTLMMGLLFAPVDSSGEEEISVMKAAEMATVFVEGEILEGKKLSEWFMVSGLWRVRIPGGVEVGEVAWRVSLADRSLDQDVTVYFKKEGKDRMRGVEIWYDGTVKLSELEVGVVPTGRRRIVLPRPVSR
jgi:hypothetical protein